MSLPGSTATPEPFFFSTFCADFIRVSACAMASSAMRLPKSTCELSHTSNGSFTTCATSFSASRLVSFSFTWPWNCGSRMRADKHEMQLRRDVLGLQPRAARQQAVMVDEGLHRFEQRGAQAGFVRAAGGRWG